MSEEFGPDFITVTDEDGNEFELEHLDTMEYNGQIYMAFYPAVEDDGEVTDVDLDDEEYGLVIMKVIEENGEEIFSTLDSEEEAEEVYQQFMERLFEDEEGKAAFSRGVTHGLYQEDRARRRCRRQARPHARRLQRAAEGRRRHR